MVLVVDDNPADITLLREGLAESARNSRVVSVSDGEQALAFLRRDGIYGNEDRPDLVIMDLNMPNKDGRAVLAEVKSDPALRSIPIVIFTSSLYGADIARSYQLGANCYVRKPGDLKGFVLAARSIEDFWLGQVSLPDQGE